MKYLKNNPFLFLVILITSCSYISGPEGLFPETKDKFFEERLAPDLQLPSSEIEINKDDHYPPISQGIPAAQIQDIPAPRQIFSSGESNEVQLRRLGELMWVYVETLPSTSWPITKNYFEASTMSIIDADPDAGIILIKHSDNLNLKITIEHGIKEASTEIFLSPGQRTLNYNLGHPTSSSDVWVELTPISWVSSTIAQDQITLVYPNPVVSVLIDSITPSSPAPGDDVTISYSLLNQGNADTLPGTIMLIDMKRDGEVLWPMSGSVSNVASVYSGETATGEIEIKWPKGSVVDLSLIWQTPHTDATGSASFLSQVDDTVEADATIDWMSIVYGSLAGLFIGLVTRTVMRARAGEPLLSRRERGERKEKPKKSSQKVVDEKVEVACPACDQRLRVPATYSGSARCPACAQTFPVEATQEPLPAPSSVEETESEEVFESDDEVVEVMSDPEPEEDKTSSSSDDVIKCPDCEQKLKVPYDRRPVRARCPACKCEFRALKR